MMIHVDAFYSIIEYLTACTQASYDCSNIASVRGLTGGYRVALREQPGPGLVRQRTGRKTSVVEGLWKAFYNFVFRALFFFVPLRNRQEKSAPVAWNACSVRVATNAQPVRETLQSTSSITRLTSHVNYQIDSEVSR